MNNTSLFSESVFPTTDEGKRAPHWLFWFAGSTLFLIVHVPQEASLQLVQSLLNIVRNSPTLHSFLSSVSGKYARSDNAQLLAIATQALIVPTKTIAFLVSVTILAIPLVSSVRRASWIWRDDKFTQRCRDAAIVFVAIAILVFPRFLQSLGNEYGRMALSPFTEGYGLYYRRLLMPALGYVLGVSGYVLYFFFSLLCTFTLIFLVRLWFEAREVHLSRLMSLSLMTSSFVIYNYQMPGYPEQLGFALILIASIVPLNWQGRVAVIALALATHEALSFALLPLIWFFVPKTERVQAFCPFLLYAAALLTGHALTEFQFVAGINHSFENGWNAQQYFLEHPLYSAAGTFFAYKLFWIFPIGAAYLALRNNDIRCALALFIILLAPLVTLPLAVDASRLVGFGYMSMMLSLLLLQKNSILSARRRHILAMVNLTVPSCYVGLNSGVNLLPGAYKVWGLLSALFPG
jgi:hypothetical protein